MISKSSTAREEFEKEKRERTEWGTRKAHGEGSSTLPLFLHVRYYPVIQEWQRTGKETWKNFLELSLLLLLLCLSCRDLSSSEAVGNLENRKCWHQLLSRFNPVPLQHKTSSLDSHSLSRSLSATDPLVVCPIVLWGHEARLAEEVASCTYTVCNLPPHLSFSNAQVFIHRINFH